MYECMRMCAGACVHLCERMYALAQAHMQAHVYTCVCVCAMHVSVYAYMCMYVHVHVPFYLSRSFDCFVYIIAG